MSKRRKPIPRFKSQAEERAVWESHDSTDYVDWTRAKRAVLPNLKPSTRSISIRLPVDLLKQIKVEANREWTGMGPRVNANPLRPSIHCAQSARKP